MEQTQVPNLEGKLREILDMVRQRGYNISCSADSLAAKIAGPIPSGENHKVPKQLTDCVHSVVDEIGRELHAFFSITEASIARAHSAVGDFGPTVSSEAFPETGGAGTGRFARA